MAKPQHSIFWMIREMPIGFTIYVATSGPALID